MCFVEPLANEVKNSFGWMVVITTSLLFGWPVAMISACSKVYYQWPSQQRGVCSTLVWSQLRVLQKICRQDDTWCATAPKGVCAYDS
jgi:hypothetical protein